MRLRKHPISRNLGDHDHEHDGRLNANNSVSFGTNGFNESSNERYYRGFQIIYAFLEFVAHILCRAKFHSKGGKILVMYLCHLLLELLVQLSIGQIDSYLAIIRLEKLRVFENI